MPIAYVRSHGTLAGTVAQPVVLAENVMAGNTIIIVAATEAQDDTLPNITGWSRPLDETATWVQLHEETVTDTRGSIFDRGILEIWSIKTTVGWAGGYNIAPTITGSVRSCVTSASEFSGVGPELSSDGNSRRFENPAFAVTAASSVNVRPGDLVVDAVATLGSGGNLTKGGSASGSNLNIGAGFGATAYLRLQSSAHEVTGPGNWTVTDSTTNSAKGLVYVGLRAANSQPYAPTLRGPVGGVVLNRAASNRLSWTFSDPDFGDSQSKADLRYRITGATDWTTVTVASPSAYWDAVGGTFTAGDYEWQVRTYDALGEVGPYSSSEFFTAADAPAGPTITYPVNGQFVELNETLVWSSADQDAYQVRRLGDDGGVPDEAVVYFDTGEVTDTTTRSLPLTFTVNARTEHVQVRVKNDGLFSPWVSVSVDVSYTPPPVPMLTFVLEPDTASLLVTITNPAPEVDQPDAIYNDVYIDDGDGFERKATALPTNSTWRYWTPKGGHDYAGSVYVVAVAANATTASST